MLCDCVTSFCVGLVGVSLWRPWRVGAPPLEPTLDRTVGRVHCPTWSLDLFLLQGLPSETRWLPGQRPVGGARPELVCYHLFLAHGTCVWRGCTLLGYSGHSEFGCLLTYRQLISGCRAARHLSPTGALPLFHDVPLFDPGEGFVNPLGSVWGIFHG